MRICSWNMRRATTASKSSWEYLQELAPDIAFLQEVGSIPPDVDAEYAVLMRAANGKDDTPQKFSTVILVRGSIEKEVTLSSAYSWVNEELHRFAGNLVAAEVVLGSGKRFRTMSVYCPAWPINPSRLRGVDVSPIKLKLNPDVWVTELMWDALRNEHMEGDPWIVGGDLNSSVTFDTMWGNEPRGNQEIQDRMKALGFVECLHSHQSTLTPTFRNPKGGKVIHQIDHLFVPQILIHCLSSCAVGNRKVVFDGSLSDHLPIIADFKLTDECLSIARQSE